MLTAMNYFYDPSSVSVTYIDHFVVVEFQSCSPYC